MSTSRRDPGELLLSVLAHSRQLLIELHTPSRGSDERKVVSCHIQAGLPPIKVMAESRNEGFLDLEAQGEALHRALALALLEIDKRCLGVA